MAVKQIQATITGKVLGVGFRYFAVHAAQKLEIDGTVRNTASGDVEVNARGDEAQLTDFIEQLRQGPSAAEVTDVRIAWVDEESVNKRTGRGFYAVT